MTRDDLRSDLPYGKPMPIGDANLWGNILDLAMHGQLAESDIDMLKLYASVRGIERTEAKIETWILRYGTTFKPIITK